MKKALAILVVIVFVASMSSAAQYLPAKDTFYRVDTDGDGLGAGNTTYGGANQQRAGKAWQDGFYMDFDRAQIQADTTAALGHTFTAADITSGAVTVTLSLMAADNGFNHAAAYTPAYFTSTTPWSESGSTFIFSDRSTSTLWNGGVGGNNNLRDCPLTFGTAQVWAAGDSIYQTFTVDNNVASGYLFATDAGVAIEMYGGDWGNNGYVFSREGTVTLFGNTSYAGPVLTVTVPEPCSMLLIAAGAVATLIRRRK